MADETENVDPLAEVDNESLRPQNETPSTNAEPSASATDILKGANAESTGANELELLGEQFDNYMRIAKGLLKTLRRPKDIVICNDLIRKVQTLNDSHHLEVRRNNNRFFRYCLRVLKWTSDNQPLHLYRNWYNRDEEESDTTGEVKSTWLKENQSYMALQSFKDGTFLVYTAEANNVEAGWQEGGLKLLERRGACEN